jgi:hypothetical protein
MSMSDHERALLVTGTLDTSGVGGSPYADLDQVTVAFGAPVHAGDHIPQEAPVEVTPEPEQKAAENSPSEPVKEPEEPKAEEKKAAAHHRTRRAPAKKAQASKPADE